MIYKLVRNLMKASINKRTAPKPEETPFQRLFVIQKNHLIPLQHH